MTSFCVCSSRITPSPQSLHGGRSHGLSGTPPSVGVHHPSGSGHPTPPHISVHHPLHPAAQPLPSHRSVSVHRKRRKFDSQHNVTRSVPTVEICWFWFLQILFLQSWEGRTVLIPVWDLFECLKWLVSFDFSMFAPPIPPPPPPLPGQSPVVDPIASIQSKYHSSSTMQVKDLVDLFVRIVDWKKTHWNVGGKKLNVTLRCKSWLQKIWVECMNEYNSEANRPT